MLTFLIYLLTIALVLNSLLLVLLVLIQLPKKEAGAGLAFGGGATDALFGAGSGNVLTRITKYSAGIFFGLALLLSVLNTHANKLSQGGAGLKNALSQPAQGPGEAFPMPPLNNAQPPAASGGTGTNLLMLGTNAKPAVQMTNPPAAESTPAAPASNAPAAPAK
jgi:preprotein translocase subunit SecG